MADHGVTPGRDGRCVACGRPLARYDGRLQHRRGRRTATWENTPGRKANWRGPKRALPLDEQFEIRRLMREAGPVGSRHATANELAARYGVSSRTIWRYAEAIPTPPGLEYLRIRLMEWAEDRDLQLLPDDLMTLLAVIARHRDAHVPEAELAA